MRVFILGGTGSIGTAIVAELVKRSHRVVALSRSEEADLKLASLGAQPMRGDLSKPKNWVGQAISCDAVVQAAATFGDDMADVDFVAMSALRKAAEKQTKQKRLIYTGGCWLYGATGDEVATETRPFDPFPPFAWMVAHAEMLLKSPKLPTAVIHPAMVYHSGAGGVFERFLRAARKGRPLEIWGSAATRWPLIERTDLARAYCDLMERPDLVGHFNAAAERGVAVGEIVAAISQAFDSPHRPVVQRIDAVIAEFGAWAEGAALDQQMSGQKLRAATGWEPSVTDYRRSIVFGNAEI